MDIWYLILALFAYKGTDATQIGPFATKEECEQAYQVFVTKKPLHSRSSGICVSATKILRDPTSQATPDL